MYSVKRNVLRKRCLRATHELEERCPAQTCSKRSSLTYRGELKRGGRVKAALCSASANVGCAWNWTPQSAWTMTVSYSAGQPPCLGIEAGSTEQGRLFADSQRIEAIFRTAAGTQAACVHTAHAISFIALTRANEEASGGSGNYWSQMRDDRRKDANRMVDRSGRAGAAWQHTSISNWRRAVCVYPRRASFRFVLVGRRPPRKCDM